MGRFLGTAIRMPSRVVERWEGSEGSGELEPSRSRSHASWSSLVRIVCVML